MPDLPVPSHATQAEVMAPSFLVQELHDWVARAFTGEQPPAAPDRIPVTVRRQDFSRLRFGRSCMETPIVIGKRHFAHGLGTHANSEIAVGIPDGARAFAAWVGIDNNYDTGGERGSVQFSVEVAGKEAMRTPTLRGRDAGQAVKVDLPADARELVLKVDTTEDGPSHDQADWGDAHFVMANGSVRYLDEDQPDPLLEAGVPFSFVYGGKPSAEFLARWKRTTATVEHAAYTEYLVAWSDPDTGLVATATVRAFRGYPAADWVLSFENRGQADTTLLEDIQALDVRVRTSNERRPAILHRLRGDSCGAESFLPFDTEIPAGKSERMAPTGGRPSSISAFPWFDLEYAEEGLIAAIGWTGQWAASFDRPERGDMAVRAGMEKTHLRLHPGERIRTPRILIMTWKGDREAAHNRWRRLLLHHFVPQHEGRPVRLPIVSQTFDRYWQTRPEWATEAGQLRAVEFAARVGCDTHWLDAAWFPGQFPHGVGNWYAKPVEFPNGLGPVGKACRERGLDFVVWFEPERVAPGTQIATEHPEFVHPSDPAQGGKGGGLFRLDDQVARRWLTDLLSQRISEYGITIYRNDFNMDPLGYWRANDTEDRQGMTEIRYVEGLYEMWDELLARHPGLRIDNCSSGGRRIDLEMCMRSLPLWRSDTSCSPGHPDWNQVQSMGLAPYVPLFTACGWTPEPYDFRSAATGGAISQWALLDDDFPVDLGRAAIAEARANTIFWYGDYYPLTGASLDPGHWAAWQFHRPDLDSGLVLAFRRAQSPYPTLEVRLRGLHPEADYQVDLIGDDRKPVRKKVAGKTLASGWALHLPQPGTSLVVRYREIGSPRCTVGSEPRL